MSDAIGDEMPAPVAMPDLEDLNSQFPNLEITRLIGRGGMGAIYHARQKSLDRDVALKLIAKDVSSDTAFVERFEREAKTLAKLSHPNIVTIYDYGQTEDGIAYLILEYVDGINLREAISSDSVGSDEALEIVSTICRALEYAHSKGVIHRDIKPENILIGEDGTLKVADFGIAKIIDDSVNTPTLTATRQVLGTLHYLAPEHLEAPDQVDHRVDLYALGVIFYELLTGQLPLGRYEAPSRVRGHVDHRLDAIVLKTLNRRPQQRYQNAADLDSDLVQFATAVEKPAATFDAESAPPQPRAESNERNISVPFTCDVMDGLAEAAGVIGARGTSLYAEFRIRDTFFGKVKSKTHLVEIPRNNLTRLELVRGFLGSRLVITTDGISALGALPNAETGRVELKLKRNDESTAREIAHRLGFDSVQQVDRQPSSGPLRWPNEPSDSERRIFAALMILCGVLNGFQTLMGLYVSAQVLDGGFRVLGIVPSALLGAIAIVQLVNGIISMVGSARTFTLITAALSLIPLGPFWFISAPAGGWALRTMLRKKAPTVVAVGKRNWGTTTLMLIRESRWAKVTGICGTGAAIVVFGVLAAIRTGYYPAEARYRIVKSDAIGPELFQSLQSRLHHSTGFRDLEYDSNEQSNLLTILGR